MRRSSASVLAPREPHSKHCLASGRVELRYDTEVDEIPDQPVHKYERVDAGIVYLPRL